MATSTAAIGTRPTENVTSAKNAIVPPCSSKKRDRSDLSKEELIILLESRDSIIAELEKENKRLKAGAASSGAKPTAADPAKIEAAVSKLKSIAARQIKAQMKWKKSLKRNRYSDKDPTARWSWSAMCDEQTYRAFRGFGPKDKTKGGKMSVDDFETLLGTYISASIRYDTLRLRGENVNFTYRDGEMKITGSYGL